MAVESGDRPARAFKRIEDNEGAGGKRRARISWAADARDAPDAEVVDEGLDADLELLALGMPTALTLAISHPCWTRSLKLVVSKMR